MKGMRNIAPFGLRMPDELREAITARAKANGRSINSEIVQILEDALAEPRYVNFHKIKRDFELKSPDEREVYLKRLETEHPQAALMLKASEEFMMNLLKIVSNTSTKKNT